MPSNTTRNARATLDQAKPVEFDLNADKGTQVNHELFGLRRLNDG
jgi:hypothetical protein